jgi:hypothetical protein
MTPSSELSALRMRMAVSLTFAAFFVLGSIGAILPVGPDQQSFLQALTSGAVTAGALTPGAGLSLGWGSAGALLSLALQLRL